MHEVERQRVDDSDVFVVALDGFTASGKSSLAEKLATFADLAIMTHTI